MTEPSPTALRAACYATTETTRRDSQVDELQQTKKKSIRVPGFFLLVGASCLFLVAPISASAQVGGVKMLPQKNQNVEPHNSRLKQRREERRRLANPSNNQPGQTGNLNSNLAFNNNTTTTNVNRGYVTSQRRTGGAPILVILGGLFIGFLALTATAVVGFIIFKSVRAKRA